VGGAVKAILEKRTKRVVLISNDDGSFGKPRLISALKG
jgi:hypothetical protein